MTKNYPPMEEELKTFPTFCLVAKKIKPIKIFSIHDYSHYLFNLHHFVKRQNYYEHPERYEGIQKLILIPKGMHEDLHSSMSDKRFKSKWEIERTDLLYRNRIVEV